MTTDHIFARARDAALSSDLHERELAAMLLEGVDVHELRELAVMHISGFVWSTRRREQERVEREASHDAARNAATQREKDKRERAEKTAREAEQRAKAEQEAFEEERAVGESLLRGWLSDPSTIPVDALRNGYENDVDMRSSWYHRNQFDNKHPLVVKVRWVLRYVALPDERKAFARLLAAELGISVFNTLNYLHCHGESISQSVADLVEETAQRTRLELTSELLNSVFALGTGKRVTWADATVDDHKQRMSMLNKNSEATVTAAARHLLAVQMIEAAGVTSLGQLDKAA